MKPSSTTKTKATALPKQEMRCSCCSCHLRGDQRKFALAGFPKFCARCAKEKVDR